MRFLVTGHTGFKGSWLAMLLASQGHEIYGFSLEGGNDSLYKEARVSELIENEMFGDIRNSNLLSRYVDFCSPEIIIHLAAQSLVLESFNDPVFTFETNVQGTLNVLSSTHQSKSVKACLIVTSDKVYKPQIEKVKFNENDCLGGIDPYSASKSMADLLTQAWVNGYSDSRIVIARAGNVIGGGDNAKDRLIPELINAIENGSVPKLRYLEAVRPWQHVLDCLSGYLALVNKVLLGEATGAWNFGPDNSDFQSVKQLVNKLYGAWGLESPEFKSITPPNHYENPFLGLDSSKANDKLGWNCQYNFSESVEKTVEWHKAKIAQMDMQEFSKNQIRDFLKA